LCPGERGRNRTPGGLGHRAPRTQREGRGNQIQSNPIGYGLRDATDRHGRREIRACLDSIAGTVEGMGSGIGAELTGKHGRADLPRATPFRGSWRVAAGGGERGMEAVAARVEGGVQAHSGRAGGRAGSAALRARACPPTLELGMPWCARLLRRDETTGATPRQGTSPRARGVRCGGPEEAWTRCGWGPTAQQ
jgi:hypothetical protein